MVKIVKSFKYVYPIDKELGGTASIMAHGTSPLHANWYRLYIRQGTILIDIQLSSIVDHGTQKDILPELQQPQYAVLYSALMELCRDFARNKFLHK